MKTFLFKTSNSYTQLSEYLIKLGLERVEEENLANYIFIDNEKDLKQAHSDVEIISLIKIQDMNHFLNNNGSLILDIERINDPYYQKILKNFFQGHSSLNLEDSLVNTFTEFHQFDLTSYLNVGQMTDELLAYAISKNVDPIAPRIFTDHIVYFLSYLRQEKYVFIPYEFEAGISNESFGIQVTVSVKDFSKSHITESFGKIANGTENLLSIALSHCDFMNIAYLHEQSKLQILGFWSSGRFGKKASLFSYQTIYESKQEESYISEEKVFAYKPFDLANLSFEEKKLKANSSHLAPKKVVQDILDEEIVNKLSSFIEKNEQQLVKGYKQEEDNFIKRLKASQKLEEFKLHISGKFDERKTLFDFDQMRGGERKEAVKGIWKNIIEETTQHYDIKSFERDKFINDTIKSLEKRLDEFLIQEEKPLDSLYESEVYEFNKNVANKFILEIIENIDIKNIENKIKETCLATLANGENVKVKLKEAISSEFQLKNFSPESLIQFNIRLEQLLLSLFPDNQEQANEIAFEISESIRKKDLENVLQNLFKEQKRVEKSLLVIDKSQNELLLEKEKVDRLSDNVLLKKLKTSQDENQKLIRNLNLYKKQNDEELIKEIERLNTSLHNKDTILQKAKNSMRELVSKKEFEIQALNKKLLSATEEDYRKPDVEELEIKNRNLEKKLELYKNKISILSEVNNSNLDKSLARAKKLSENALKFERKKNLQLELELNEAKNLEKKLRQELMSTGLQNKGKNESHVLQLRVKELEEKLKYLIAQNVEHQNVSNTSGAKEKQFETQLKKLNQELVKAHSSIFEEKKNSVKMRSENTALKNQIVKLEKELQRLAAERSAKKAA